MKVLFKILKFYFFYSDFFEIFLHFQAWLSDTETNEKGSDLKAPATNLELSAQASYLEIYFEDIKVQ